MRDQDKDRSGLASELETVEQLIADGTRRAADLEKAVGVMQRLGGDTAAADKALLAAYQGLAVNTRRRATLLKLLAGS